MKTEGFCPFEIIINVLVYFFRSIFNPYVMGLRLLYIVLLLQSGIAESDVYGRQILTTKVDPCAVRVKLKSYRLVLGLILKT